jgi:hypothetical protein
MPELGEGRFERLLRRFAIERFLYRLGRSPDRDRFVLKGATLLFAFGGRAARPTRDLDLLGFGALGDEDLRATLSRICAAPLEAPDGVEFLPAQVVLTPIRVEHEYGGTRILLPYSVDTARDRIQIDVGIGDVVYPEPEELSYPTLLDLPSPRVRAYRKETVIAEKLEALVKLGETNSRLKDFYDLWALSSDETFSGRELAAAIRKTFDHRQTAWPAEEPEGLNPAFFEDEARQRAWASFVQDRLLLTTAPPFPVIGHSLRAFLLPLLRGAHTRVSAIQQDWSPTEGWK